MLSFHLNGHEITLGQGGGLGIEKIEGYASFMTSQEDQPSALDHIRLAVIVLVGLAVALFILLGSAGVFDGGNVPDKECFNYEKANGDWANSCDQ